MAKFFSPKLPLKLPLIYLIILLFFPLVGQAAVDVKAPPNIKVSIGDKSGSAIFKAIEEVDCPNSPSGKCYQIGWIGQYISALYQYGVGLAAVLAVVMIMAGGFIWLTAAGNPSQVGKAKEFISSALLGLFLALFSYVILNALNPRLVNLEPLEVVKIKQINYEQQCCIDSAGTPGWYSLETDKKCSDFGTGWKDGGRACTDIDCSKYSADQCPTSLCSLDPVPDGSTFLCRNKSNVCSIKGQSACRSSAECKWENGECIYIGEAAKQDIENCKNITDYGQCRANEACVWKTAPTGEGYCDGK